jgi:hypothetical protein
MEYPTDKENLPGLMVIYMMECSKMARGTGSERGSTWTALNILASILKTNLMERVGNSIIFIMIVFK